MPQQRGLVSAFNRVNLFIKILDPSVKRPKIIRNVDWPEAQ